MGGSNLCRVTTIDSPIGPLLAGACNDGICLLAFTDSGRPARELAALRRRVRCDIQDGDHPLLVRLHHELDQYFAGRLTEFTVPVVTAGTPFQERVWAQLRQIPYGETWSYEELAHAADAAGAYRAVGHANGSNPVPIVIPCHRVINKSGRLGGYGGELWRKEVLLRLERSRTGLPFHDADSSISRGS